jgi:hypothetical protein
MSRRSLPELGDLPGQAVELGLADVQQLQPAPRGDRCRAQLVLPHPDLADDLARTELGDLRALLPAAGQRREQRQVAR